MKTVYVYINGIQPQYIALNYSRFDHARSSPKPESGPDAATYGLAAGRVASRNSGTFRDSGVGGRVVLGLTRCSLLQYTQAAGGNSSRVRASKSAKQTENELTV